MGWLVATGLLLTQGVCLVVDMFYYCFLNLFKPEVLFKTNEQYVME